MSVFTSMLITYIAIQLSLDSLSQLIKCTDDITHWSLDKMHSYRRETALQGALLYIVLDKSGRLELETIFYGHYRSIWNHSDIIDLQSYRIR